ncbi:MAG: hypothetical protein PVJ21_16735 [Anaerolineales bacterium]
MNKTVRTSMHHAYLRMLDQGNFPEVGWSRNGIVEYDTANYLQFWGRLAFLVDQNLKSAGHTLGCYELKRSDNFRKDVIASIRAVTPEMIISSPGILGIPV